jgi:arsenate reductase
MKKKYILVLCTGNSCRSQMAEGWLRHFGGSEVAVFSAGIETHGLNPMAVEAMAESGIDISNHSSDLIDSFLDKTFDHVLTVCDNARESCPVFPGPTPMQHHSFPDPAIVTGDQDTIKKAFAEVRDQIRDYCQTFVKTNVL